jgi:hypothetical protein
MGRGTMTTRRYFLKTFGAVTLGVAASPHETPHATPDTASRSVKQDGAESRWSKAAQDTTSLKVESYLSRMHELSSVVERTLASGEKPLAKYSIFLVHHLTGEVLGLIAALRKLGCRDIVTVFVGYNADLENAYRPDLDDLPTDEFRCYVLDTKPESHEAADTAYFIPRSFVRQPSTDSVAVLDALDATMKSKNLDFVAAMRALSVQVCLAQFARTRAAARRLLLIEDGGYAAPILNEAAISGQTVSVFRAQHGAPDDRVTDAKLSVTTKDLVTETMVGSIEHTRNGYDENMRTYLAHGRLAVPAFSIAISYIKTQVESNTVAATILNAVESVLYSHGASLGRRNVFLFGSRGNIGRRLMSQLRGRLDLPDSALIGCDLKVGRPDTRKTLPAWQLRPSQSSAGGAIEVATYAEVDAERTRDLDLILGVTGGPTSGHPVLQVQDVVRWLIEGRRSELHIVSGSSKTAEFPEVLEWMNSALRRATVESPEIAIELEGLHAHVRKWDVTDLLSHRSFGSRYAFTIEQKDGSRRERSLLFMQNLTPVNFLFYGVPTEVIDQVLAQLVSPGLALVRKADSLPERRLYAVDYDPEASVGVYGARPPEPGTRIPLPQPAES